ncbi:ABC-type phosphate/phosphonate transport system substrate-binding protein [Duganella sp. SG902]|uniref:phosphate/phosphite/phosphonate ABC transporter substrate-binding protein n=1 Tax=Duganella sp. SG902 TaxID=2587016 RepID=UPI00159E33CE|nr:PhnD/SsuA/transferrin family substrate-binding protein [Duganella sp. SG902]NVM74376.1 ABC-type phosphate/phosphonate transport system substrate-binding protein [Duganella sp. SG902]
MNWTVSLPMYNVTPRLQREYEALLATLLVDAGVRDEAQLLREPELPALWRRPDLLVGQTCGYPYVSFLRGVTTLLATPCFDFPGCDGSNYASVIVTRAVDGVKSLAEARGLTAAVNDQHSNSGMNVLRHAAAPLARDGRFFGRVKWTGSHVASLRAVREEEADIAAIDCVTFGYLRGELPDIIQGIKILQYSASSPGLPLITAHSVPDEVRLHLRRALLSPSPRLREHMTAVRIKAFQHRPDADYNRIAQLESEAVAAGYPALFSGDRAVMPPS